MKLAITYQNERLEQEAKDLILSLPGAEAYMCDVSKDEEINRLFATLKERHGKLHTLVHSVAYAPADELKGDFLNTSMRFTTVFKTLIRAHHFQFPSMMVQGA